MTRVEAEVDVGEDDVGLEIWFLSLHSHSQKFFLISVITCRVGAFNANLFIGSLEEDFLKLKDYNVSSYLP
jgi:hypothetical protein